MTRMSRRGFIQSLGASLLALGLPGVGRAEAGARNGGLSGVLGFGRAKIDGEWAYFASTADPFAGSVEPMEIPFFGHGCNFFPDAPNLAFVFEKRGLGCCILDWTSGEVVRTIAPASGRMFYGHGAFAPGGAHIYASQTIAATGEGLVAILDAQGHELGTFPTHGARPHDLRLIDDGKVLVAGNAGGVHGDEAPSVTYVDVQSHKLLERVGVKDDDINVGHIDIAADGELVMASAPREGMSKEGRGGVALRPQGGEPRQMPSAPAIPGMVGEALSICIDETRRLVAVTHPSGGLMTVWDLDGQRMRASIDLPDVRGVVQAGDGEHLVVSHGQGELSLFSWSKLRIVKSVPLRITPFSGSHLYRLPTVG